VKVSLACPDWQDRIRNGRSLIPDLPIDEARGARAVGIFNKLRLPDVPGTPALAEASGDWFREIVKVFMGAFLPNSEERFIRELLLLAPKKSAKTSLGAAFMITALLMNVRPRAEFLIVAPTKIIADLAYSQAVGMRDADPDGFLQKRLHVQDHLRTITDRKRESKLLIKSFDSGVLTGVKPAGVLMDELHEIARDAAASRIIGQLRGGLLPNPEAFLAFITTQSDQPPTGAFKAELHKGRMIRDGKAGGAMLPVLYEFPDDIIAADGWKDSDNWWMVTPNRGKSVTIPRLIDDFEGAKLAGDAEIKRWLSQHLNVEIGLRLASDNWAGAEFWEKCGDRSLTFDTLLGRCEVIVFGIDGGGLDDLLGFCAAGRDKITGEILVWLHAWAHQSVLERRKGEASRLESLAADGDLTIVDRVGDDVIAVADYVERANQAGLLADDAAIGVDPVGIGAIVEEIVGRGIEKERVVGVAQGWGLNSAIKTTER
jgi:phage terminase large subunit-like protein